MMEDDGIRFKAQPEYVFKQCFASVAWVWKTSAKFVDMRAAVLFVIVSLLLSGKGSFSFSQEFQLALSQFSKNSALEIHPSIKWYCNLVLER